jgi:gliding motility-associated-like protein
LNNTNTANPIAILNEQVDSILYKVRLTAEGGCYGEDEIKVRVFTTGPDILVPSGFTPNGDGKNDLLKPFTVGISKINYFQVYNRWGELVFATTQLGVGWDGSYNNKPQASGTYVFQVEGVDYLGKKVYKKGTSVLIR